MEFSYTKNVCSMNINYKLKDSGGSDVKISFIFDVAKWVKLYQWQLSKRSNIDRDVRIQCSEQMRNWTKEEGWVIERVSSKSELNECNAPEKRAKKRMLASLFDYKFCSRKCIDIVVHSAQNYEIIFSLWCGRKRKIFDQR